MREPVVWSGVPGTPRLGFRVIIDRSRNDIQPAAIAWALDWLGWWVPKWERDGTCTLDRSIPHRERPGLPCVLVGRILSVLLRSSFGLGLLGQFLGY